MPELTDAVKKAKEEKNEVLGVMNYCKTHMKIKITEAELETFAALKVAMKNLIQKYGCQAAAIQCLSLIHICRQDLFALFPVY